jgi:tetratricopeptide (TPR) repeat protein
MTFLARLLPIAAMVLVAAALAGCSPSGQSQAEEEKESHFQTGKSCLNSMDFIGAIESFEKALEVNPRSASAHFELACLFDQKQSDPAAAIYHYEKYLKLRPDAGNADRARERIYVCKQDLAKSVLPLPVAPAMQRQFEQLAEQNRQLQEELEHWKAYYNRQAPTGLPVQVPGRVAQSSSNTGSSWTNSFSQTGGAGRPASPLRTYLVQQGETFSSIARKQGVKLDALLAANPGVQPRNLRAGQTINLPP